MDYEICSSLLPTYYNAARLSFPGNEPLLPYKATYPEQITALHYHSCLEIGICLAGSGINHVDNRIYHYNLGDIQWVKPYQPHLSATEEGVESRWEWISIDCPAFLEAAGIADTALYIKLLEKGFGGMLHPDEHPDFTAGILRLRDLLASPAKPLAEREVGLLLATLIIHVARFSEENFQKDGQRFQKIRPCVDHISSNYADKEAMREEVLAQMIGVSPSHLRYLFRKEAGIPPRTFVLHTRLAAAAHRLRNGKDSVLGIAMDSGFEHISCFNRVFRKEYGMTPTEYRKQSLA